MTFAEHQYDDLAAQKEKRMSKLFAGLLIGVAIVAGMVAVPQTIAATTSTSVTTTETATSDHSPMVITLRNTRGIDVALYQAHRQISQARRGCHDSGSNDSMIRQRKRSSHIALY